MLNRNNPNPNNKGLSEEYKVSEILGETCPCASPYSQGFWCSRIKGKCPFKGLNENGNSYVCHEFMEALSGN